MKNINESNIPRSLYGLDKSRYPGSNWMVRKWWDLSIYINKCKQKKLGKYSRKFLFEDIRLLRYNKLNFRRLRYFDNTGILKSEMFRIKYQNGIFRITQYPNSTPLTVNKPKGPMKFRCLECTDINYKWLGIHSVLSWEVDFQSSL